MGFVEVADTSEECEEAIEDYSSLDSDRTIPVAERLFLLAYQGKSRYVISFSYQTRRSSFVGQIRYRCEKVEIYAWCFRHAAVWSYEAMQRSNAQLHVPDSRRSEAFRMPPDGMAAIRGRAIKLRRPI